MQCIKILWNWPYRPPWSFKDRHFVSVRGSVCWEGKSEIPRNNPFQVKYTHGVLYGTMEKICIRHDWQSETTMRPMYAGMCLQLKLLPFGSTWNSHFGQFWVARPAESIVIAHQPIILLTEPRKFAIVLCFVARLGVQEKFCIYEFGGRLALNTWRQLFLNSYNILKQK